MTVQCAMCNVLFNINQSFIRFPYDFLDIIKSMVYSRQISLFGREVNYENVIFYASTATFYFC